VRTAAEFDLVARCVVIPLPAERAVRAVLGRFDLVFADPPYAQPYPGTTFATLRARGAIDEASLVIYEHSAKIAPPVDTAFPLARTERYGAVALTFLKPERIAS